MPRFSRGKGRGCQDFQGALETGDALAAVDLVCKVVLETDDGELLNVVIGDVIVELGRQHRGDVVGAIREHDAVPLLLLRICLLFVLERADICAAGRRGDDEMSGSGRNVSRPREGVGRARTRDRACSRDERDTAGHPRLFWRLATPCRDAPAIWSTEFNPWSPWCRRSECPVERSYPDMIVRSRRSFLEDSLPVSRASESASPVVALASFRRQPAFENDELAGQHQICTGTSMGHSVYLVRTVNALHRWFTNPEMTSDVVREWRAARIRDRAVEVALRLVCSRR